MKTVARNKRANFDYAIERTITAGIALTGSEAKSIRQGAVSIKGSYAQFKNNELWLLNMHVTPYAHAHSDATAEPTRTRKLLLHKKELTKLTVERESGLSIMPLQVLAGRHIKIELGIGRGKKRTDKRQAIKKRDAERDIARSSRIKHKLS
jgi:SsrA-binding protein